MTLESGTSSFRTWRWGPGRHSMRVLTDGLGADGNPWRDLDVYYWHPGHSQVRLFGASPYARGISEGTIRFEGEAAQSDFDLYQTGGRRRLRFLWTFDGPDKYYATLLEASPPESPRFSALVAWDLFRAEPPVPARPFAVEGAAGPSDLLRPLRSLLGMWEARVDTAVAGVFHARSTFEWIPLADAVYAQVLAPSKDGGPAHLLDAYFYHHTGADALRCLALSSAGGVYEGDVTVLDGGALQLDLKGFEGGGIVPYVVRFDFEQDETLRHRVWAVDDSERTLMLDVRHKRLGPE